MYNRCFLLLGALLSSINYATAFTAPMRSLKTVNHFMETNQHHALISHTSKNPESRTSSLTMLAASSPAAAWAIGHALGGALGAPIVAKAVKSWYKKIDLPPWTPPDRLFAPTWTALYSAMGVAAYRVYQQTGSMTSKPMKLWLVHYFLFNLPWAPAFFGMKRLRLGLVLNFLMVGSLVGLIIPLFYASNAISGLLLLPYLGWLSFATVLNYAICKRNPTDKYGYNAAKFQAGLEALQKEAATYAGL